MKLYAICLIKNEEDIVAQTLTYATRYCDRIFVLDNGSTDATWDIVRDLSRKEERIVPFAQTTQPYSDGLRAMVYNEIHGNLSDDDWWMILDSDEFVAEDPKALIEIARRDGADVIRSWQIQFYFTEKDHEIWEAGRDGRDRPIFERRRHYLINWQEPRLFRNQTASPWDVTINNNVPNGLKRVWHRRILNRHYQFRDPEQIEKRLRLRFGDPSFRAHVTSVDWRSTIRDSRNLSYYRDGDPWRFKASGVVYYYRRIALDTLRGKIQGGMRRFRNLWKQGLSA